jgi:hypothetical protein
MKATNKYLLLGLIFLVFICACSVSADENDSQKNEEKPRAENECPKGNHSDSIIPIVYGYPTEQDFKDSKSGLIVLGGCELPKNPTKYWCKIHKIDF